MPAQFSKDKRVFLALEYTKRRGRKWVQNENIQVPWCAQSLKTPNFCGFFVISHLIFDEILENNRINIFQKCFKKFIFSKKIGFADFFLMFQKCF